MIMYDVIPKSYSFTNKVISVLDYIHNGCSCLFRYFLERSNSAKMILKSAKELFPIEIHCKHCMNDIGIVLWQVLR